VTVLTRESLRALPHLPLSVLPVPAPAARSPRRTVGLSASTVAPAVSEPLDTFICVHSRDLGHLFELTLRSYEQNFQPKGRLFMVTNDLQALRDMLDRTGLGADAQLMADDELLSTHERTLPGWYRQQIVKMRAHEFCVSENFCNLGADTVLLQPVVREDLVAEDRPILYYNGPRGYSIATPDFWMDRWYEMIRIDYVSKILRVTPNVSRRYVDFIFDLFCFNRGHLADLNRYLARLHGPDYFYALLNGLGDADRKQFGEWTLYSMYLLDCVRAPVEMRNSAASFLRQIRNRRILKGYQFDSKVVHFVDKSLSPSEITERIIASNLPLGRQLAALAEPSASPIRSAAERAVTEPTCIS
jgi:hypothetical protein